MIYAWVLLVLLVSPAWSVEQLDLTTPVTTPSVTSWTPDEVHLSWDARNITVIYRGSAGERKTCTWTGQDAADKMTALNKANLSAGNSLHKRLITQGQALAGCLGAGTVSGSPD